MPSNRNFLTLHVGQAGCQIGHAVWELLTLEHNVRPDGCIWSQNCEDDRASYDSMFIRSPTGRFQPRGVFIDTEPACVDEMRMGQYRCLFSDTQLLSAGEDAAANYMVGRHRFAALVAKSVESVRWMMEKTELTPTFFVIHSTSGGTGSGVTMACLEQLSEMVGDTKKLEVMELSLLPGRRSLMSQAEILNSALYQSESGQLTSVSFGASNSSLFNVCSSSLGLSSATFAHANRLLAAAVSNLTATERYPGSMPCTMSSICTNVLPLRHLKYPVLACCPFLSCRAADRAALNAGVITRGVFLPSSQFLDVDMTTSTQLACALLYRGGLRVFDINKAVLALKAESRLQFARWCPIGFKVGLVEAPPLSAPLSGMGNPAMSVTLVSNTTAIAPVLQLLADTTRKILAKGSLTHHYQTEAEELSFQDFSACADTLEEVVQHYQDSVSLSESAPSSLVSSVEQQLSTGSNSEGSDYLRNALRPRRCCRRGCSSKKRQRNVSNKPSDRGEEAEAEADQEDVQDVPAKVRKWLTSSEIPATSCGAVGDHLLSVDDILAETRATIQQLTRLSAT